MAIQVCCVSKLAHLWTRAASNPIKNKNSYINGFGPKHSKLKSPFKNFYFSLDDTLLNQGHMIDITLRLFLL
jgi:hypothetical protein